MKLTPIDIQQQQFRSIWRGYDPREVQSYMELLAQQLGEQTRTVNELRDALRQTERELEDHRERETTLREAMLTAQRAIDEIREQAEKQAQLITSEADLRAEKILLNAHKRVSTVLEDIQDLKRQRARALSELRGIINTHHKLLEVHEREGEVEKDEANLAVLERVRAPKPPKLEELEQRKSG